MPTDEQQYVQETPNPISEYDWEGPFDPNDECDYRHITLNTPIGKYRIQWKGWKDYPDYSVVLDGEYVKSESSLDDAKSYVITSLKHLREVLDKFCDERSVEQPSPQAYLYFAMFDTTMDPVLYGRNISFTNLFASGLSKEIAIDKALSYTNEEMEVFSATIFKTIKSLLETLDKERIQK